MPPRPRLQPVLGHLAPSRRTQYVCQQCRNASMAAAVTPAPSQDQMTHDPRIIARHRTNQPPSYKPAEFRKTQLHRTYQSMLRSMPLILLFQHNNLKSAEWISIKRELASALLKLDTQLAKDGNTQHVGQSTKLQVVQTGIFASALRVVEFWEPKFDDQQSMSGSGLSEEAWKAGKAKGRHHGLEALLSGPLAALQIPTVSPQHVKVALSILAPTKEIPAPKRKAQPTYHEADVQNGLKKLMLLGARVDGQAFDFEGARWIANIEGGMGGLHAQLVHMLQGVGSSLTRTLDSASRNLYMTVEGRRMALEDESKDKNETPSNGS